MTKLDEIEAALAAATEGPWRCDKTFERMLDTPFKYRVVSEAPDLRQSRAITDDRLRIENAELIALLRNMAPDLVRVVKAAKVYFEAERADGITAAEVIRAEQELDEALAPLVEEEK